MGRRALEDLPIVGPDQVVYRLILGAHFKASAHIGLRIQTGNMPKKQWAASESSYGPSVFVAAELGRDEERRLAALAAANPKWGRYGIGATTVRALEALGLQVRASPEDCDLPGVQAAHASILGVSSDELRAGVLRAFDLGLVRLPA